MSASRFISKSACRGYRPKQFVSYGGRQRSRLISQLAKSRTVSRFIVAPSGYGKTCLAIEYAETMFAWVHVFWLKAQSPCFIRDLDAHVIASACLECDDQAKLVVIDDVPLLDDERCESLSDEIDALLERGCEVILTCSPSCDLYGSRQRDRLRLGAVDLLLDDDELDGERSEEERAVRPSPELPAADRVPMLVWGGPGASAAFVASGLEEAHPADVLLMMCSMFVLRKGALSGLTALGLPEGLCADDVFADYPHYCVDRESDSFEAPLIEVDLVASVVKKRLDAMAGQAGFGTRTALVCAWADMLLANADGAGRACDLMRALCPMKGRIDWLQAQARTLVRRGCFFEWLRAMQSLEGTRYEGRTRIAAAEALCHRVLGDEDGAIRLAKCCAFEKGVASDAQAIGLLVLARHAVGELRVRAAEALLAWSASVPEDGVLTWPDALVVAWCARSWGIERLASTWVELREAGADDDVLCVIASWLFQLVGEAFSTHQPTDAAHVDAVERFVRERLSDETAPSCDFLVASAGLSLEEAHVKGMSYSAGPLEAPILLALRRAEVAALAQRRRFAHEQRLTQARQPRIAASDRFADADGSRYLVPAEERAIPTLELRLFGRFDIAIGGVPVAQRRISRKNARILLALLAIARGRDLTREAVLDAMWPTSSPDVARKNYYTVWSQLKRALTLPDGTCPYLVRHQYGCHLEDRYVRSDVARLEDICRTLLFGKLDFEEWLEIYNEIDRDFSCTMLPAEGDNPLIVKARDDCSTRLVDALVTATQRLIDAGNPQWGIWFARSAIAHAPAREDVYVAMMRAQIASDQRTAAMMTYLSCRRALSDELGIDPSPETSALYDSLLGST